MLVTRRRVCPSLPSQWRSDQSALPPRRPNRRIAGITLSASGTIGDDGVSCSVQTGKALVEAGLHPATAGDGSLACSGHMLLEALVACAGVTLQSVAVNRGIEIRGGTLRAEGELDFRGTLGVDLDTDASAEDVESLIALTERYCVVLQTIARTPKLEVVVADS